jgi:hypothetical protein
MNITRSNFKKVWMLAVGVFLCISIYMYQQGENYQARVMRESSKKSQLTSALRVGNKLSADLVRLDSFTINETGATKLDVLRYLGLETTDLQIDISDKSVLKSGGKTPLYQRDFTMTGTLPYADLLDQIDTIHNTKKVIITNIDLSVGKKNIGDLVDFNVKGVMYGLEKK